VRSVSFGSLCDLRNGRAFKPEEWSEQGTPIVRIQNLNDESKPFNYCDFEVEEKFWVNTGDLLFSWSGTPGTSFGAFFWNRGRGFLNQHIFRVDVNETLVDKAYLRYALNSLLDKIIGQSHGGVGLKHITKAKLESVQIPLPPLPEQRRIAAILDKADALGAKRREAISKLDQLLQSVFLEMFGDPVTNPKGWPQVRFSELLESIDSGTSPVCLDRPAIDNEWAVLKLSAVTRCEYDPSANKALPDGVEPDKSLEVKVGDLLFTRKNTRDLVAACAFVTDTPPRLLLPDLIFRFRLKNQAPVVPRYLQALLAFPGKRKDIQSLAGGSAGSMPNISKAKLSNVLIELPPKDLQCEFELRLKHFDQLKEQQRLASAKLDATFYALQQQAFTGQL
jgi:type I restriction enzyme S subunit